MEVFTILPAMPRSFFCGGREVLRVKIPIVKGDSPLAAHLRALFAELLSYAEHSLFSDAAKAWETAAREGAAHRFTVRRFAVTVKSEARKSELCVTVFAALCCGKEEAFSRALFMRWSRGGEYQKSARARRETRKEQKKARARRSAT